MKKRAFLFALLLGILAWGNAFSQASGLNMVSFANETGFELAYLFFSPGDSEQWGPDLLGVSESLQSGESRDFFIHYPEECGSFDFMAVDTDGDAYLIWDYQICDGRSERVAVTLDEFNGPAPPMSYVDLRIINELPYDIFYLFLSPGDSRMWGVDYLSSPGVLESGRLSSFLVPATEEPVEYHLVAVDEQGDLYSFAMDLEAGEERYQFSIELGDLQGRER